MMESAKITGDALRGSGNEGAIKETKLLFRENANALYSMPKDTPIDLANNHRGAEIADTTNDWGDLVRKIAESASFAPQNDGKGK